jgi:hypothetical protein
MLCFHRRYHIGDEHKLTVDEARKIEKDTRKYVSLPLYMMDHGSIALSTTPFSSAWDSGRLGLIYVSRDAIRKEYNCKHINKGVMQAVSHRLRQEVECLSLYLQGFVYEAKFTYSDDSTDYCSGIIAHDEREAFLYAARIA